MIKGKSKVGNSKVRSWADRKDAGALAQLMGKNRERDGRGVGESRDGSYTQGNAPGGGKPVRASESGDPPHGRLLLTAATARLRPVAAGIDAASPRSPSN
jgi:hypothetical protein